MARLLVRNGAQAGRSCTILGEILIGRGADCDLSLDDPRISRNHLRITADKGRLLAEDLGSSNGTQMNGKPFSHGVLHIGDELQLGGDVLVSVEDDEGRPFALETRLRPLHFQQGHTPGVMEAWLEDIRFSACEHLGQLVLSYYYATSQAPEEGEVELPLDATLQQIAQAMYRIHERRHNSPPYA